MKYSFFRMIKTNYAHRSRYFQGCTYVAFRWFSLFIVLIFFYDGTISRRVKMLYLSLLIYFLVFFNVTNSNWGMLNEIYGKYKHLKIKVIAKLQNYVIRERIIIQILVMLYNRSMQFHNSRSDTILYRIF